jgi:MFS transporter, ACS family, glucarate transporter
VLLGIVGGLVWFVLARNRPDKHPWVSNAEVSFVTRGIEGVASIGSSPTLIDIVYQQGFWTAYIFFTWFFIYLTTVRGLDLRTGAYYAMLPCIAMTLCSAVGGAISDAVSRRMGRRWGRVGMSALGLGTASIFVEPSGR